MARERSTRGHCGEVPIRWLLLFPRPSFSPKFACQSLLIATAQAFLFPYIWFQLGASFLFSIGARFKARDNSEDTMETWQVSASIAFLQLLRRVL